MHAGVALMYQLAAIVGIVTEGTTQGTDGVWRQASKVDHQGVTCRFGWCVSVRLLSL